MTVDAPAQNPNGYAPDGTHGGHVEWEDEDEVAQQKSSLCCLQGCLAVSSIGFSFFVALPTGIILLVLAINSNDVTLIAVGGVLVSLPVLMFVIVLVLCLNQDRISRWFPWKSSKMKGPNPNTLDPAAKTPPPSPPQPLPPAVPAESPV